MDTYSSDSSPPSPADTTSEDHSRVKLMVSYGGRIQPRPHDHHLSYVSGETKILAIDRAARLPALLSKLASLSNAPSPADLSLKYQLPGEDLDALISVTDDDDLDHMMLEYDRLRTNTNPNSKTPRLRLFLFPVGPPPPPPSAALLDPNAKPDRHHWFLDALNSVPLDTATTPDYLFGLDNLKPSVQDIPNLDKLAISDNHKPPLSPQQPPQQQQPPSQPMSRNASEETLPRINNNSSPVGFQEKAVPAAPAGYWPAPARYASVAAGEQAVYLIPAPAAGVYAGGQGYFHAAPMVYAVPSPAGAKGGGVAVAYDSAGRAVYYTSAAAAVPTYQTVTSVAEGVKAAVNPSQLSS